MPNRRHYLSLTAAAVTAGLAGCAGRSKSPKAPTTEEATDSGTPTEPTSQSDETTTEAQTTTATPESVRAAIGDPVEGDRLTLIVQGFQRGIDLGEYSASDGNELAVVSVALQNTSSEYVTIDDHPQTRLRDVNNYVYAPKQASTDATTTITGQFPPDEVGRVDLPFEIPKDADGLEFLFNTNGDMFGNIKLIIIDIQSTASSS